MLEQNENNEPFRIIEAYCKKYVYKCLFSKINAYIATPVSLWRIRLLTDGCIGLMHHNFLKGLDVLDADDKKLVYNVVNYHYQHGKVSFSSVDAVIMYIYHHDTSREHEIRGVQTMPTTTRNQKKWKKQAGNGKRRREIRRVEKIFAKLGKEETKKL